MLWKFSKNCWFSEVYEQSVPHAAVQLHNLSLQVPVKWRKESSTWAKKFWTFLNDSVSLLCPHWWRVSLLLPPVMGSWGSINNLWSFHCVCQVFLDNILVSLNDNGKKGGCFGVVGMVFCIFVGLVACFLWNGVSKKGNFWNLENLQENTATVAELSFLTPDSVEFSHLSNLLETGLGDAWMQAEKPCAFSWTVLWN